MHCRVPGSIAFRLMSSISLLLSSSNDGVLGLVELPRPESFDFARAWYRVGSRPSSVVRERDAGSARHFCFWIEDVRPAARTLETVGHRISRPESFKIPGGGPLGIRPG